MLVGCVTGVVGYYALMRIKSKGETHSLDMPVSSKHSTKVTLTSLNVRPD